MQPDNSKRNLLAGAAAGLLLCAAGLQAFIDPIRRQPAIEPPKSGQVKDFTIESNGQTAALPFIYTLGAMTGFRQVISGMLWVRSDSFFHEGNYDAILPLIRLITWLDPNWLDPYATGAWHLMYNFTDTDQRSDRRYLVPGMALLKEGIANNPHIYDMYKEAGWNEFDKIKNYAKSAEYYSGAEENDPNYDVTQVGHALAHCYERLGQTDKAIAEWEKCIAKHKAIMEDKDSPQDAKARNSQGYANAMQNLAILRLRAAARTKDALPPIDAQFSVQVVRTKPKVLEVSGTWNLVGAINGLSYHNGALISGPVDGARVTVRLQDAGYTMPEPKEFSFEVDPTLTIMQDQLSVTGGKQVQAGELYVTQKGDFGSVQDPAKKVGVYGFGPKDNAATLGVPIDKALAGAVPLTEWGKQQAVTVAYPLPYDPRGVKKLYTPAEVAQRFPTLLADKAKIAQLVKDGYCVASHAAIAPGRFKREIDMSKDPKMYSFANSKYDLIVSTNPRVAPDFVKDRIGWNGEGLTDKKYLDDKSEPGTHQLVCKIEFPKDDITGQGRKQLFPAQ